MRFRNKMAYDLIKGIPQMMGLRTQFVHLYVRDLTQMDSSDAFQDYGLVHAGGTAEQDSA